MRSGYIYHCRKYLPILGNIWGKMFFADRVFANKNLFEDRVSANKKLFTDTGVPIEKKHVKGGVYYMVVYYRYTICK